MASRIFFSKTYGRIDGAVTTFAVVSGVAGARLSPWIILVLGFANLFADGFSMAAGNFLGTKAEQEDWRRLEAIENRHIDLAPEGEREEVRQIYRLKGFEGDGATRSHAWKPRIQLRSIPGSFNGATRSHAWKRRSKANSFDHPFPLQWSHAISRVETN